MDKRKRTNREKREICEGIAMTALWIMILSAFCAWIFGQEINFIVKPVGVISLGIFLAAAYKGGLFRG